MNDQIDKFLNFACLTVEQQELLAKWRSPGGEQSVIKAPIELLEEMRSIAKLIANGRRVRVKFRGPRYDKNRMTCLKEDAHSFAIFLD